MAGPNEILGPRIRVGELADGRGPLGGGDPGTGAPSEIDRDVHGSTLVITGSRQVLAKGRWRARPGTVRVHILDLVETTGLSFEDRDRLRDTVAARLHAALQEGPPVPAIAPAAASSTASS